MKRALTLLATIAAAVAVTVPMLPASASTTTLCAQYAHVTTTSRNGARVEARNDWWAASGCIAASTTRPQFRVSTYYRAVAGKVVAFPEMLRGCQYGYCTGRSGFPRRVSQTSDAVGKWSTRYDNVGGEHNTAFDIWFGRSADYSGHAQGAELMIWLNSHNLGHPYGEPVVWVDGRAWWLSYWRTCVPGTSTCWNYVRFWAVHPVNGVSWLRLHPFMRRMERLGRLRSWWYLWNVEAGYECWSGCKGMTTTWFWARA